MCMRYADANPGHPFCVTKQGEDLFRAWRVEQVKRDAEAFGVMAYTDYSGYGTAEVVGNMVCKNEFTCRDHNYAYSKMGSEANMTLAAPCV